MPRSLGRWRRQLQLFSDESATALGGLVRRLAPAVDALFAAQQVPSGDVDGFDGIGRRGSYERLLPTEWMLQQAAPLEFLRRVSSAELSFFQLALRQPASRESTLVLLDAGPDQLGDCRLAQLALLVLLIERAEANGQDLRWQLLHLQAEGLRSGLDEQVVRGFLAGRTGSRSSAATLDAWAEASQQRRLWLIGAPAVMALGRSAFARVSLQEQVTPRSRLLDVKLESGGQARGVVLTLPEPATAARLLRDPFEQAKAPKATNDAIASHLLLSPSGSRLFYRNLGGQLVSVPIANSPRAPAGSPRRYPVAEGAMISSVGGRGRKLVWLSHARGEVSANFADDKQRPKVPLTADSPLPDRDALSPLAWFPGEQMAVYRGHDRKLWRTDFRTEKSRCIAGVVRGWLTLRERSLVAVDGWRAADSTPGVIELKPYKEAPVIVASRPWNDAKLATLDQSGAAFTLGVEQDGIWELQEHVQDGAKFKLSLSTSLHTPPHAIVLGVEAYAAQHRRPGLWLLEADRRTISLVRLRHARRILTTSDPIAHACLASAAPVLAATTVSGELFVVDDAGRVLYRGNANQ
jgi:hypothetical protein